MALLSTERKSASCCRLYGMVMEALFSPLLDYMRKSGAAVALKAVVTEQNRAWSGAALCRELQREHEAMRSFAAKKPAHPHKKKK